MTAALAIDPHLPVSPNMTQQELAWALNTTQATVSRWLSGARRPPLEVRSRLMRLAAAPDYPYEVIDAGDRRRGGVIVPDAVWTPVFAPRNVVRLPIHLDWSGTSADRVRDVSTLSGRAKVYQLVVTEGSAADIVRWVDMDEFARTIDARVWSRRHQRVWRDVLTQRGFNCGAES